MVLKLKARSGTIPYKFESCAVYDGTQTPDLVDVQFPMFESCAVYDGTQTVIAAAIVDLPFESCAVYDGTQTLNNGARPE